VLGPEGDPGLSPCREDGGTAGGGALYAVALDGGVRQAELCGLRWSDLDWPTGVLTIRQQLSRQRPGPVWGPPKNGRPRSLHLSAETLARLRKHLAHQAELKMSNRTTYHDHGLMFCKEWEDLHAQTYALGDPLAMQHLGNQFARVTTAAGVRRIKFHGMRHTCATLLLQANVPVKVVQERLGHASIEITLNVYAHVLPSMQEDAAAKVGAILYG
jgi:integrase